MRDKISRSVCKALSFILMSFTFGKLLNLIDLEALIGFIGFWIAGGYATAMQVISIVIGPVVGFVLFMVNERVWNRVNWGRDI